jgi:hypothetical protein
MTYQLGSIIGWPGLRKAIAEENYAKAADEILLNKDKTGPSLLAKQTPDRAKKYADTLREIDSWKETIPVSPIINKPAVKTVTNSAPKKVESPKLDLTKSNKILSNNDKINSNEIINILNKKGSDVKDEGILNKISNLYNIGASVISNLMDDDIRVNEDTKGYIKNKLLKDGIIEETSTVVKYTPVKIESKDYNIPFQKLASVSSKESPNEKYMSYRRQESNDKGLTYIPTPRKEKWKGFKKDKTLDDMGYETGSGGEYITKGVEGIAHFLIDNDISGDKKEQFKNTKNSIEALKKDNTKWLPVYKKNKDGTVTIKYTQGVNEFKKLAKEGYDDFANLRQLKVSDINWNSEKQPIGFGKYVRNLTDKNGKDTFLLFRPSGNKKYSGKDAMGKFEGNSVVLLFKDANGKGVIREYAGSLNGIIQEIKNIKTTYKVNDSDITVGFYDSGSYSAKPEAKNGILKSSSYGGFNNQAVSGAGLAIPIAKK